MDYKIANKHYINISKAYKWFIKKFYGHILEWPSFYDSFKSAIGSHPLDDAEKFYYLKLLLPGQALASMNGLPVQNSSYNKATNFGNILYGNKNWKIT